jgi:hypothetical protein
MLKRAIEVCERVPAVDPPPCYWLHEDASESFCRKHVIEARGREFDLGAPLKDRPHWERDDWEDAFFEGIGASEGSESDHSEACAVCGATLSYVFTDHGADEELRYWLDSPIIALNGEATYILDRMAMHVWPGAQRRRLVETAAVVNQAWRLLATPNNDLPTGNDGGRE